MLIKIRDAQIDDLKRIADINVKAWKYAYKGIIEEEVLNKINANEKAKKMIEIFNNGSNFIVAEIDKQIVGYCTFVSNNTFSSSFKDIDCEILALYVDPDFHRKGIGKELVECIKDKFTKEGKKKMIIWCLKDNNEAKKFYIKVGGIEYSEKTINIGEKEYKETGFMYKL